MDIFFEKLSFFQALGVLMKLAYFVRTRLPEPGAVLPFPLSFLLGQLLLKDKVWFPALSNYIY